MTQYFRANKTLHTRIIGDSVVDVDTKHNEISLNPYSREWWLEHGLKSDEATFHNAFYKVRAEHDKAMSTAIIVSPIPGADAILAEAFKDDQHYKKVEDTITFNKAFNNDEGEE